jgi:hypothetical protein
MITSPSVACVGADLAWNPARKRGCRASTGDYFASSLSSTPGRRRDSDEHRVGHRARALRMSQLAVLAEPGWQKVVDTAPGHVAAVRRLLIDELSPSDLASLGQITRKFSRPKASTPSSRTVRCLRLNPPTFAK